MSAGTGALGKPAIGPLGVRTALRTHSRKAVRAGTLFGLGYVGLPLTLLFTEAGFPVTGFDIDPEKVKALNNGRSYIYRIPETEIAAAAAKGFWATDEYGHIKDMDAVIICVPTPLNEYHEPDLSYIRDTAKAIAPHVHPEQLVVLESTTYPGTTEEVLVPVIEAGNQAGLKAARGEQDDAAKTFLVAFSPEREDPGNDTVARKDIPIVVGGLNPAASEIAGAVYNSIFNRVVPVSSPAVAEMTKLLENIYRCVNIALVNELKMLCLRMNIDVWEVIDAAKTKPFGFMPFYPGPGLGGHCIPIDPYYLSWKARQSGFECRFIELAGHVNSSMPEYVVERVAEALNSVRKPINGSSILLVGVAYKKDVNDMRESPALDILELLARRGARLSYTDPWVPQLKHDKQTLASVDLAAALAQKPDCAVICTDHSSFDYDALIKSGTLVVDTRNALKAHQGPNIFRL
jgi:UDP-N-acetyl-D-glucosamine dehydrogenase